MNSTKLKGVSSRGYQKEGGIPYIYTRIPPPPSLREGVVHALFISLIFFSPRCLSLLKSCIHCTQPLEHSLRTSLLGTNSCTRSSLLGSLCVQRSWFETIRNRSHPSRQEFNLMALVVCRVFRRPSMSRTTPSYRSLSIFLSSSLLCVPLYQKSSPVVFPSISFPLSRVVGTTRNVSNAPLPPSGM